LRPNTEVNVINLPKETEEKVSESGVAKQLSPGVAAAIALSITAVVVAIIIYLFQKRRRDTKQQAEVQQLTSGLVERARSKVLTHFEHVFSGPDKDDRAAAVANVARWLACSRIAPSQIEIKQLLGIGRFGTIHAVAIRMSKSTTVAAVAKACAGGENGRREGMVNIAMAARGFAGAPAAPTSTSSSRMRDVCDAEQLVLFCAEALLMGAMHHPNILSVVGVILDTLPMQIMTEHMRNGDLKSYLRACRPTSKIAKEKLNAAKLLEICSQIASACVYLEKLKVVHRGVMASNVLIGTDHTQLKLGGFTSLREVRRADEYVKTSTKEDTDLDIRWMATECFTDNTFSTKSDVWSFAVLVWEVFSFARKPYGTFHPHEIAAEVRAGRLLERAELCPVALHDWMERCWSAVPTNRPTFSAMQGTIRLLLLDDADKLRAKVAAATRLQPDANDETVQWALPMRGWESEPAGLTDCGRFQLITYRSNAATGGSDDATSKHPRPAKVRLGIAATSPEDVATLKTVFTVLQDLKHVHVVELIGCSMLNGFVVLFEADSLTLGAALHNSKEDVVPDLLATHSSKVDAALQMALGIEYLHAGHLVHGRLSSTSFYFDAGGTNIRLLLGNVLHADGHSKQLQPAATHRYPSNLRWAPPELVPCRGQQQQALRAPTSAADVFGFGVILWELYADAGVPHSSAYSTDDDLFDDAATSGGGIPGLAAPFWGAGTDQAAMLDSIFIACVQPSPGDRPFISGVASTFLDEGPDRWEKDRTELQFVQHLGSGQFGDVSKMSTLRVFRQKFTLEDAIGSHDIPLGCSLFLPVHTVNYVQTLKAPDCSVQTNLSTL
jgi:serine/threonine protein kinase